MILRSSHIVLFKIYVMSKIYLENLGLEEACSQDQVNGGSVIAVVVWAITALATTIFCDAILDPESTAEAWAAGRAKAFGE